MKKSNKCEACFRHYKLPQEPDYIRRHICFTCETMACAYKSTVRAIADVYNREVFDVLKANVVYHKLSISYESDNA